MSAMIDITPFQPERAPRPEYPALRDLMLAISLTILAALAMEATGAPATGTTPVVQEWKGNSGTLPTPR